MKALLPLQQVQTIMEADPEMVELKARIDAYRTYRDVFVKWWRWFAYIRIGMEISALERRADKRFQELMA
jgi:hypothetical protein